MWPELTVGGLALSTYALTYGVATVFAGMVALHRLDDLGLPRRRSLAATAATVVGGLLGSVILWALMGWIAARCGRPEWFSVEGSTILGVLLFGFPTALVALRLAGAPVAAAGDAFMTSIPLGQAIGRIGCLFAGCCAGRPTGSWLAVNLPDGTDHWCPRYPTQLIAAAADLGIFVLLTVLLRRFGPGGSDDRPRLHPGELTALYFLLYGCKRFAMEFIRINQTVLGPLTWAHLISALFVAAALIGFVIIRRRPRRISD